MVGAKEKASFLIFKPGKMKNIKWQFDFLYREIAFVISH